MFFYASVSSFLVFFYLVAFAPSVNQALLSLQQLRGDAGGGGLGSGLDGGRWLRDPGDSNCSFLSAAAPSLLFLTLSFVSAQKLHLPSSVLVSLFSILSQYLFSFQNSLFFQFKNNSLPLSSVHYFSSLSPRFNSLFIGEKESVRLKSRNGWSASDPFGGLKVWGFGGGEEREAGRFENGFRLLLLLIRGERRKMNRG